MSFHDLVHELVYQQVGEAVAQVAHMEPGTDEAAITKRVSKHIYKAACDQELLTMPWEQACSEFVERAMSAYHSAAGEQPWFYCIDLVPAFAQAAAEIVSSGLRKKVQLGAIQEIVHAEYESAVDKAKLESVLWEIVQESFTCDAKAKNKIYTALTKAYTPALQEVLSDAQLLRLDMTQGLDQATELRRLETFVRAWLSDGFGRCWVVLENSGARFDEEVLHNIIGAMIAPYGERHWMTCMPGCLIENVGRPPMNWSFIRHLIEDLFAEWRGEAPASKKRKLGQRAPAKQQDDFAEPSAPFSAFGGGGQKGASKGKKGKEKGGAAKGVGRGKGKGRQEELASQHPSCTSADDCIGTPEDALVRHIHNGEAGDIYCEQCWGSFVQRNPSLEGQYEE